VLGSGNAALIDNINSVDVQLVDSDQWLTSCDDDALACGSNLAVLGSELFQFGNATQLGDGSWRLSRLLRGRAGTEWAMDIHETGETFCMIRADDVRTIVLPQWVIGSDVTVTAATGAACTLTLTGESLRPPSPVNLSAELQQDGSMLLNWTRRSRSGWSWNDEVDAPLAEGREQYSVSISGTGGTVQLTTDQPMLSVAPDQLALAGTGSAVVEVNQVGDWALSKPAQLAIMLG
jgi:hypothetical protein